MLTPSQLEQIDILARTSQGRQQVAPLVPEILEHLRGFREALRNALLVVVDDLPPGLPDQELLARAHLLAVRPLAEGLMDRLDASGAGSVRATVTRVGKPTVEVTVRLQADGL